MTEVHEIKTASVTQLKNMSTVSSTIMGGLGNQMFIIANMIAYARRTHRKIQFCKSQHSHDRPTYWDTMFHGLGDESITKVEVEYVDQHVLNTQGRHKYTEQKISFDEIPDFTSSPLVWLEGYFQSARYLQGIEDDLVSIFQPSRDVEAILSHLWDEILIENSLTGDESFVALHVRRADYLSSTNSKIHGTLPPSYYLAASQLFTDGDESSPNNLVVVVFSDDVQWRPFMVPRVLGWSGPITRRCASWH